MQMRHRLAPSRLITGVTCVDSDKSPDAVGRYCSDLIFTGGFVSRAIFKDHFNPKKAWSDERATGIEPA